MPPETTTTSASILSDFRKRGQSITTWAAEHGFSHRLVYAVLSGKRKCLRGESHAIAVALGLKILQKSEDS